tara:strand:+ start:257 stop:859 length:603 start_codon:yes stop_codon:yes gene_type:complete
MMTNTTKRRLLRIIRESGRDWDLEDNVSYFITSGPAETAINYLEELIAHAEAGGDVGWEDAMNSVEPEHTTLEYAKKRLEMLKSGSGIGHSHQLEGRNKMKITKRQLKRIIREEKSRILSEDYGMHEEDVILEVLQDYIAQGLEQLGTSDNIWLEGSEIQYYVKMAANHMGTGGVTYHRERGPAKPKYDASIAHLAPEEK